MNPTYMTDEDAELFVQFRKYQNLFLRLDELHCFQLRDGKIEILIDHLGRVGDIYIHTRHK